MYFFKVPFVFFATTFVTSAVLATPIGVVINPKAQFTIFDLNQIKNEVTNFRSDLNRLPAAGQPGIQTLSHDFNILIGEMVETVGDINKEGPFNKKNSKGIINDQVIPMWQSMNDTLNAFTQQKSFFESVTASHPDTIPDIQKNLQNFSMAAQSLQNAVKTNFKRKTVTKETPVFQSFQATLNNTIDAFSS